MGIVNRSKDVSEQQRDIYVDVQATSTGVTKQMYHVPHAMEIQSMKALAEGISGTPTALVKIQRFVVGEGETQISITPALTLQSVGTSGPQAFVISSAALQAGDQLVVTHGGTNAAAADLGISLVVKALQDIKSWDY